MITPLLGTGLGISFEFRGLVLPNEAELHLVCRYRLKGTMTEPTYLWPTGPRPVGIAADHGGHELKRFLTVLLRKSGHEVIDFGNRQLNSDDDYPDFIIPLGCAVARGDVGRGIAICGSGVGACIAANKVAGVRACLIHETFSAHQGVEDDDLNLICLGGRVVGHGLAWELVQTFLAARFSGAWRHRRRVAKFAQLEAGGAGHCADANHRLGPVKPPPASLGPPARKSVSDAEADWRDEGNPN